MAALLALVVVGRTRLLNSIIVNIR